MEGIHKLASKIDIGLVLAEVSGDVLNHKIVVDEENSKIDIYCIPNNPLKEIKFNLKIIHE
jgi:hypothetical protein